MDFKELLSKRFLKILEDPLFQLAKTQKALEKQRTAAKAKPKTAKQLEAEKRKQRNQAKKNTMASLSRLTGVSEKEEQWSQEDEEEEEMMELERSVVTDALKEVLTPKNKGKDVLTPKNKGPKTRSKKN